ncbi:MAG: hypothetical protein IH876_03525, partial [Gemmatimonadetes bacterium]|nr:hypothetical protein [Gemmatimonadota bacterium]
MKQRFRKRGLFACILAAAAWACEEGTGPASSSTSDVIPPTVSIVLADSLININEGLQFTLRGNDNISLLTIGWSITGAVTRDTLITFTATTQTFQEVFTVTEGFTGGTFTIVATATDGAGNAATPDTATASVFDALAPSHTLIAPVAGEQFITGSTMDIIVSVTDPSGVQQIVGELFSRDQFSQPVIIASDTTNITTQPLPTAIEDTLSVTIPNTLLPGTYEVRTFAVDGASPPRTGFSNSVNVSILDGIPPGGSFISPPVDSLVLAGDEVPVRFRATDLTGVDSVIFTAVGKRGVDSLGTAEFVVRYFPKTAIINQSPDTSIIRILAPVLTDSTVEQVTITGTVYDVGGTSTSITTTIQVVTGPTASITSPASSATLPVGVPVSIDVVASSPDGIATVIATTSGVVSGADTVQFSTPLDPIATANLSVPVAADAPLGDLAIDVVAIDGAGRTILADRVTVTLADQQAPTLTFTDPTTGTMVRAGDSLLVAVRVQDNRGVTNVTFNGISHRGDPLVGTDTVVTRFDEKSIALSPAATDTTSTRYLFPVLTDSTAETAYMRVTVQDSSGNVTTDSVQVNIVNGPTLLITSPVGGSTHPVGTPITVAMSGFSPDDIATIRIEASGVISGADTVVFTAPLSNSATTSITLSVPNNADLGEVTILGFATDAIGTVIPSDTITIRLVDDQAPTISFTLPTSSFLVRTRDSVRVSVRVQDNKGVASVTLDGVAHRGVLSLGTDTVVQRFDEKQLTLNQVPDTTLLRDLLATAGDESAETAYVRVVATDSTGNTARDSVLIQVIQGPALSILLPADSSLVAPGLDISITIRGEAETGIKKIGYTTSGVLTVTDTTTTLPTTNPQVEDTSLVFTLSVPAATPVGFFTINPFGRDSLGNVGTGDGITVEVVAIPASDTAPPLVTDSLDLRTESDDTIKVRARDVSGITLVGFTVIDLTTLVIDSSVTPFDTTTSDTLSRGSTVFAGNSSDVTTLFELGLDTVTRFSPALEVYVTAFALDSVGNRGVLSKTSVALSVADGEKADTVTLVAGHTVPLPQGGTVADAIYNRNNNKVYLTNPDLDQVEVFNIATTKFETSIAVGSRPWGIGLWPVNTDSVHGDTIVVANSGGTNLSIVDVSGTPVEVRRHALPNFEIHSVLTDPFTGATGGRL